MSKSASAPRNGPKRGTGREIAYRVLRSRILDLTLEPGTPLEEAVLVRDLRLSRTPLREAFVRLASENLVELLPNRGARVAEITVTQLSQYFEALALMQRATHRWAATRRTDRDLRQIAAHRDAFVKGARQDTIAVPELNRAFHAAIAACCGNSHVSKLYNELLDQGLRLARLTLDHVASATHTPEMHTERLIAEHAAIFDAIEGRDPEAADRLASSHNDLFRRRLYDYFVNRRNAAADLVSLAQSG